MDGCFKLSGSLGLCILVLFLLPTNCFDSFFVCVDGFFLFVLFNFHCALCSVSWEKMKCGLLSVDQWIYFYLIHIFSYFQFSKYLKRLEFMH